MVQAPTATKAEAETETAMEVDAHTTETAPPPPTLTPAAAAKPDTTEPVEPTAAPGATPEHQEPVKTEATAMEVEVVPPTESTLGAPTPAVGSEQLAAAVPTQPSDAAAIKAENAGGDGEMAREAAVSVTGEADGTMTTTTTQAPAPAPAQEAMSNISISSDLPTTAFTTSLKEEFVEGSTEQHTPLPSPLRRGSVSAASLAPTSVAAAAAQRPQIIIEDGSFLSSQFATTSHSPSSLGGAADTAVPATLGSTLNEPTSAVYATEEGSSGAPRAGRSGTRVRKREGELKTEEPATAGGRERRDSKRSRRTSASGPSSRSSSARRATSESNGADDGASSNPTHVHEGVNIVHSLAVPLTRQRMK
jgi:hypothetical protein